MARGLAQAGRANADGVVNSGGWPTTSGGCLLLDATVELGGKVGKLAMYEAPYNDDPAAQKAWGEYLTSLTELLASDRRGDAVALFMALVGMPAAQMEGMRQAPSWAGMEAIAPTLAYDHTGIMGKHASIPTERAAQIQVPTLVISGTSGAPFMLKTAKTLTRTIPGPSCARWTVRLTTSTPRYSPRSWRNSLQPEPIEG